MTGGGEWGVGEAGKPSGPWRNRFDEHGAAIGTAGEGQGFGAIKAVVLVEGDQVFGGGGGVERQFSVTVASRPAVGVFEQAAADATALEFRLDGELVQAGHASTSVNLALRRTLVPVQGERADDAPAADGDETLALTDPLARDGDRLVATNVPLMLPSPPTRTTTTLISRTIDPV